MTTVKRFIETNIAPKTKHVYNYFRINIKKKSR